MRRSPARSIAPLLAAAAIAGAGAPSRAQTVTVWPGVAPCAGRGTWQELLRAHQRRYPAMGVADALKLLQQATLGSEHWVREGEAAGWMQREWASLGPGPDEPLVDTLGPGGAFARIHLRPWRAAGGAPGPLVHAFVATGQAGRPDTAALGCALEALAAEPRPWPAESVAAAVAAWRARGYPAMQHSEGFTAAYRPAYRVVALSQVPALLAALRRPAEHHD